MSKAMIAKTLGHRAGAHIKGVAFYDDVHKRVLPLLDGQIFGRRSGDGYFVDDKLMSREHCRIRLIRSGVFIEDLGSSNATRVNQKPIPAGVPVMIKCGDIIQIGNQCFRLGFTSNGKRE